MEGQVGSTGCRSREQGDDSDADIEAPLVATKIELKGPYVLGYFPFFVDDVLKLKDAEKKCPRSHCIGPVMRLAIWAPLVHASVMFFFMGLGVLHMRQTSNPEVSYPLWWLLLAVVSCIALVCMEVHIAKYSSISFSDKARDHCGERSAEGRLPIGWPCPPVSVIDTLFYRFSFSGVRARWLIDQDQWYFNVWFFWHFALGMVTVFGRLQANTFLGMLLYRFESGTHTTTVVGIWKEVMRQSAFMRHFIPLEGVLIVMGLAQIIHWLFGALNYCPRRKWKTADHLRWQERMNDGRGGWTTWGRTFEFEVKGMSWGEERITQMSEWDEWTNGFEGVQATATGANGEEVFLTVPRGGPARKGKVEYRPSDADLPFTMKWVTNRHAYTSVPGVEMTSATVMDVIAESCSMGFIMAMQSLELDEYKKAAGFLTKYQNEPTEKMAGELIQAVRALMNGAVNVTRCAFSRVFINGICFVGIHLHFQVTYTNILCASDTRSDQCRRAQSLWLGIFAAFVTMGLVLAKVVAITRYQLNVWSIVRDYNSALSSEHADLVRFSSMQGQIKHQKCSLLCLSTLLFPASFMFVGNFVWLTAKWYMESFVCPSHVWNIPAWLNIVDIMSGCVELSVSTSI